jgi:xylulose-5-phosphate/fructose-6-phosphate phosphoketolase
MSNVETLPRAASGFEPLTADEIRKMNAYWSACNYLSAGMLYLCSNPLLREPLKPEHIKNRLLGHWGSDPGQSFIWVHMNRLIKKYDLNTISISGPGHGAPATLSNSYLEGVYSEVYPDKGQDVTGLQKILQAVFFPRRDRFALHAGDARIDSRGWGTGLFDFARVRGGLRQS